MDTFQERLEALLTERNLTQSLFAEKTGSSQQGISQVLSGQRNPPKQLETLRRWADVLKLSGAERAEFLDLADLARASESVQTRIRRLAQENEKLRDELQRVTNQFRAFKDFEATTRRLMP